ncbi:Uncharacterised protein [Mycobacteroides abscessus subsp. abscessus]|nr:Uncharacterised protein [Mycobacteroides abscessus subsp. abscessus]
MPRSTKSTNRGHATAVISVSRAAANASWYAPEAMVASVPMTPILLLCVVCTARRTAGSTTSMTGTGAYRSRASRRHAADAVLQAITRAFTPRPTRSSPMVSACLRISGMVSGPYGPLPVSPTYRMSSSGS